MSRPATVHTETQCFLPTLFFCLFYFLFYEYQRIYCFFSFLRLWPFWLFVAPFPLAWFHVSFFCREKKTWKTMRWCYCSCSFLSHHYLSFTVGAYTHKRNPSSAKDVIFNITCLHLPTRLLRFLFLFFAISLPMFFVWQRRWTHTLKLRF
ncbi:hypothetical protein AAZV13_10G070100 [Glycine max]